MTTELTLREKVLQTVSTPGLCSPELIVSHIADLLSATGAPAYCRVADDLRGVVREEERVVTNSEGYNFDHDRLEFWPVREPASHTPARYLGQFDKRGGE